MRRKRRREGRGGRGGRRDILQTKEACETLQLVEFELGDMRVDFVTTEPGRSYCKPTKY
jgi:hypothetical protein